MLEVEDKRETRLGSNNSLTTQTVTSGSPRVGRVGPNKLDHDNCSDASPPFRLPCDVIGNWKRGGHVPTACASPVIVTLLEYAYCISIKQLNVYPRFTLSHPAEERAAGQSTLAIARTTHAMLPPQEHLSRDLKSRPYQS